MLDIPTFWVFLHAALLRFKMSTAACAQLPLYSAAPAETGNRIFTCKAPEIRGGLGRGYNVDSTCVSRFRQRRIHVTSWSFRGWATWDPRWKAWHSPLDHPLDYPRGCDVFSSTLHLRGNYVAPWWGRLQVASTSIDLPEVSVLKLSLKFWTLKKCAKDSRKSLHAETVEVRWTS